MTSICYPDSTDWSCLAEGVTLDPDIKARAEALAWHSLWSLTGRSISICPVTVRPCTTGCKEGTWLEAPVSGSGPFRPGMNAQGYWVNSCGCGRRDDCSCTTLSEVVLPGPVGSIVEVLVDGIPLGRVAYRVDNGVRLVRLDGGSWPACQDMSEPETEPGTFAVKYHVGFAPNAMIDAAAGKLALEFAKACQGQKCALPKGVTSVTRNGVSMEIGQGMFPNGFTGIFEVDAVIQIYNPHGRVQRSVIASPDSRRGRMTTVR